MKRSGTKQGGWCIAVVALGLLAGCDVSLTEPGVKVKADESRGDAAAKAPGQPTPPEAAQPVAAPAAVPEPGPTKPFDFQAPSQPPALGASCRFENLTLPPNTKVYAAGAYGGKEANFQIDQSGHQATTIQVAVNEPKAPVVLLLGAYEPTVWSVGWTQPTRIVAVLVTGYHRQRLTGLPAGIPLLVSSYEDRGPCDSAYVGGDGSAKLNPLARAVFGRPVDTAYTARDGHVTIGNLPAGVALVTDAAAKPAAEFRQTDLPPAGQAGIDAAMRDGTLRASTQADLNAWIAANRRNGGGADLPRIEGGSSAPASLPYRSYTVLKPFTIPAGLNGAHSATFFVAAGVQAPIGNPGHSQVRFIEHGSCSGLTCGMR